MRSERNSLLPGLHTLSFLLPSRSLKNDADMLHIIHRLDSTHLHTNRARTVTTAFPQSNTIASVESMERILERPPWVVHHHRHSCIVDCNKKDFPLVAVGKRLTRSPAVVGPEMWKRPPKLPTRDVPWRTLRLLHSCHHHDDDADHRDDAGLSSFFSATSLLQSTERLLKRRQMAVCRCCRCYYYVAASGGVSRNHPRRYSSIIARNVMLEGVPKKS